MEQYLFETMVTDLKYIVHRQATPSWCIKGHRCESDVLIFVYEGVLRYRRNLEYFEAKKGDLVYFKRGDYREADTDKHALMKCYSVDFSYACVQFDKSETQLMYPPLPIEGQETIGEVELMNKLIAKFERLSRYWLSKHPKRTYNCRLIFSQIIVLLLDYKRGESYNDHKSMLIERVTRFMEEHYDEKITLKLLAEQINISPSYLGCIFKEMIGTTPVDYLLHIRVQKAKELISDGQKIAEIAVAVGFTDVFYFSKMFKKIVGIAPTEYRRIDNP